MKRMTAHIYTVKELHDRLEELINEGHGEKGVWITSDDEGNAYHPLLYLVTEDEESVAECVDAGLMVGHCDPEITVLLG